MACQSNPETYAIVIRLPIEEGAALKSLADSEGVAISAFVAGMIHEKVKGHKLDVAERAKTAAGYYKRKRRGRPRKPGPKGKKRKGGK